jgi:hypothetical protein
MPLLKLLGYPMSLADLRQVYYWDIDNWAKECGLRRTETIGALYRFGWAQKGVADLIKRVPLAAKDKGVPLESLDVTSFNQWLTAQGEPGAELLDALESRGLLRRITRPVTLELRQVDGVSSELFERMRQYINEDVTSDPFWTSEPPFCHFGGEGIYFLESQE